MREQYEDKKGRKRLREHWKGYGNRKKKDKSRYKEMPSISNKFKGHTHLVRIRKDKTKVVRK